MRVITYAVANPDGSFRYYAYHEHEQDPHHAGEGNSSQEAAADLARLDEERDEANGQDRYEYEMGDWQ